ncbi:MAG: heavy-metal-associated domain-containing protein [Actinobacteria bacterium]|nr:heavy-metal-associated domain-containing protein [Actinomycetota bacterium]
MITTTYLVKGMTCSHCVSGLTQELSPLTGVTGVTINLVPDGLSEVVVTSNQPLDQTQVEAAIDEAGHELDSVVEKS